LAARSNRMNSDAKTNYYAADERLIGKPQIAVNVQLSKGPSIFGLTGTTADRYGSRAGVPGASFVSRPEACLSNVAIQLRR